MRIKDWTKKAKIISFVILITLIMQILMPIVSTSVVSQSITASGITVKFESDATNINAGETVSVKIYVTGVPINYMSFYLNYDTNIFNEIGKSSIVVNSKLTADEDYGMWSKTLSTDGNNKISISDNNGGSYTIPDDGLLATIKFVAKVSTSVSTFEFNNIEIVNSSNVTVSAGSTTLNVPEVKTTYPVTYNANCEDATNMPSNQTKTEGINLTLSSTTPTRTGYTFTGWNTEANGSGTTYAANATYSTDADLNLYAQWKPVTYVITYNANGGLLQPNFTQTKTYGTDLTLTLTKPTRLGYTFSSWNTKANGSGTTYAPGATYSANSEATLYAQWTVNKYTITFNNQDATTAGTVSATATYDAAMPNITVPSKTGYTFGGYYTAENGSGTQYYTSEGTSARNWDLAADTTLYAKWTPITYTITYTLNGGLNNSNNPSSYNVNSSAITIQDASKTGYTFNGWTSTSQGITTPTKNPVIAAGSTGNKTFTANFTANQYTISLNNQGATTAGTTSTIATYDAAMPSITVPTRTGYTFGGYYTAENGSGTQYYTSTGLSAKNWNLDADTTLYAKWTPITYIIKYNGNGNTIGSMSNSTFTYDTTSQVLRPNTFEKDGYTFEGWDTDSAGTTVVYTNAQNVGNLSTTSGETINLYAVWVPITMTVTFNLNTSDSSATVSPTTKNVAYDSTYGVLPIPERTGYTFGGWYTTTALTTKIESTTTVTKMTNHSLYAKWIGDSYQIKYYDGSTLLSTSTKTHDVNTTINYSVQSKQGYTFKGWATADDLLVVKYTNNTTYTDNADISLYAVWEKLQYTVIFYDDDRTTVLKTETVEYGNSATAPSDPTKPATAQYTYTFAGWDKTFNNVSADINVYARYTATTNKYTVTFYDDDRTTVLKTETVEYGNSATAPSDPTKPATAQYTYTFAGWDKTFNNVSADINVYATYTETINEYTVTFYDEDGTTVLETKKIKYGQNVTYTGNTPAGTNEKGYSKTFVGWDDENKLQNITEDRKIYATYTKEVITYNINYEDTYGAENTNIMQYTVEDEDITLNDLSREGYEFKGWYTTRNYTEQVKIIDTSVAENITLYAWWNGTNNSETIVTANIYYVKVLFEDETTKENTFEYFNDARIYADIHAKENVRVFDSKGHIVYEPNISLEDLYLKSNVYTIGNTHDYKKGDLYIKQILPRTTLRTFINQSITNGNIEVYKTDGAKLGEDEYIGTNMILRVTKDEQIIVLTTSVIGDIDGNGKITVTDLSMLNKQIIGDVELNQGGTLAADIDLNGEITITDLSKLNKILIGNIII